MTDLEEAKAARDTLTTKLGDVVRQLAFSGIAVVWIIKTEPTKTGLQFDDAFYRPLKWFVICLAVDLVQYLWAGAAWDGIVAFWTWFRKATDQMPKEFSLVSMVTRIFLFAKTVILIIGFYLLLSLINHRLSSMPPAREIPAFQSGH